MRRSSVALTTLVGSLVVAACSSDNATTSPRGISPRVASADFTTPSAACSFSTMNQDAKGYAPAKDVIFTMISDMKSLYKTDLGGATRKGFDILARVATLRRSGGEIGDATAGGTFVLDVVRCMDVGTVFEAKFKPDLALASGVFEVRGGSADDTGPTLALNASPNIQATEVSPRWGAEPQTLLNWSRSAATYGRYLVYGYPLGTDVRSDGFELGTLPDGVSNPGVPGELFRVGLCIAPTNSTGQANRLLHQSAVVTDVSNPGNGEIQGTNFCVGQPLSATSANWLKALASRVVSFVSPNLAFAEGFTYDGIGGLPDGWSPFDPSAITAGNVVLKFGPLPANAVANVDFTIIVNAASSELSGSGAVPGVLVNLSIAGNSGDPADAVLYGDTSVATDQYGDATFTVHVGKAGGYTLAAAGKLSGLDTKSATSGVFNVKNQ